MLYCDTGTSTFFSHSDSFHFPYSCTCCVYALSSASNVFMSVMWINDKNAENARNFTYFLRGKSVCKNMQKNRPRLKMSSFAIASIRVDINPFYCWQLIHFLRSTSSFRRAHCVDRIVSSMCERIFAAFRYNLIGLFSKRTAFFSSTLSFFCFALQ